MCVLNCESLPIYTVSLSKKPEERHSSLIIREKKHRAITSKLEAYEKLGLNERLLKKTIANLLEATFTTTGNPLVL